jgi:hypothetical protein
MGNEGTLEITLLGVDAQPAKDPETFISFTRMSDGQEILRFKRSFPPKRPFTLPAFPQERAIGCRITPERYRSREVGIFTLTDGETIQRQPTVFRVPQHWEAEFVKWANLPTGLQPLRDVLEASLAVRVKGGKLLGQFVRAAFDDVDPADRVTVNAKACMLNLFAKLGTLKEPVFNRKPWFGFVENILEIGRERMIALVDEDMLTRVQDIHRKIDDFEFYKRTPVGDHANNVPAGFTFAKSKMVSIKTQEEHGNLQLTLTPATDSSGTSVTILDTDIDENGKLMAHLADLFKHRFNGGTHPFDIHEFLVLEDPSRALGYELV